MSRLDGSPKLTNDSSSATVTLGNVRRRRRELTIDQFSLMILVFSINYLTMPIFVYIVGPHIVQNFKFVGLISLIICLITWLLTISALTITSISDPGYLPRATLAFEEHLQKSLMAPTAKSMVISVKVAGVYVFSKWCTTCHHFRPVRCSHCSVCDRCIEIYDHHCPYLGTCIGQRNHKLFFIMLVNMFLEFVSFSTIATITLICIPRAKRSDKEFIVTSILLLISVVCALPMINLLIRHFRLATKNRTTRDLYKHIFAVQPKKDPFDEGLGINMKNFLFSPQRSSILDHIPKRDLNGNP